MSLSLRAPLLLATLAVVGVAFAGGTVKAQDGTMTVVATVNAACSVVANPTLDFGVYDPAQNSDAATSFDVDCTAGTDVDVFLDAGLNANGSSRNLANANGDHIGYILFHDAIGGATWSVDFGKPITVDGGTATSVDVFGRIPSGGNFAAGNYSDTVGITLSVN